MKKMFCDKRFYIICAISLLFFGILFKFQYATDTYVVQLDIVEYSKWALQTGRPINALLFYVFGVMNAPVQALYYFSFTAGLILLPFAIYLTMDLFENKLNKWMALLFALILIINPFVIEYFLFIESCCFIMCILLTIISIRFFVKFIGGKRLCIIPCLCLEIIVCFSYQNMIALFAVLAICFIALKVKKIKPFLLYTVVAIGIYGLAALPDFIFMKVSGMATRTSTGIEFGNIIKVLTAGGPVVTCIAIITIVGVIFLLAFLKHKYRGDGRCYWVHLSIYAFLFLGSIIATLAPYLFVDPASAVPSYRTLYPLIVLLVYLIFEFAFKEKFEQLQIKPRKWQVSAIIGCLVAEFALFQTIFVGRFINNAEDEKEIRLIQNEITKYETESGTKITSLSFYKDGDSHVSHDGAICLGINLKAFMTSWSDIASVNALLNTKYVKVDNDKTIYNTYFKDYKSNTFDASKQLVFLDNVLHIYVY